MNYKMMGKFISQILFVEAAFMLPALLISVLERNIPGIWGFALSIVITAAVAPFLYVLCRHAVRRFYAREGLVCVGMSWIFLSLMGGLPFSYRERFQIIWMRCLKSYLDLRRPVHRFCRMWKVCQKACSTGEASATGWVEWACSSFSLRWEPRETKEADLRCICCAQRARDRPSESLFRRCVLRHVFCI